jgi:hypothetical protein
VLDQLLNFEVPPKLGYVMYGEANGKRQQNIIQVKEERLREQLTTQLGCCAATLALRYLS